MSMLNPIFLMFCGKNTYIAKMIVIDQCRLFNQIKFKVYCSFRKNKKKEDIKSLGIIYGEFIQ